MTEKSDTRLKNIDALKGFIIILVVLGHVLNGYLYGGFSPDDNRLFWSAYNIIYVFHMPMMMTVSGYMFLKAYYHREGKAYVMDKDRYLKHLANLIFVYLLYSLIYGIIKLTVPGYVSNDVTQLDVLKILVKTIAPFWYLYILIIFFLVFPLYMALLNKISAKHFRFAAMISMVIFMIIGFTGDYVVDQTRESVAELYRLCKYSGFFAVGINYAIAGIGRDDKELKRKRVISAAVLFVMGVIICCAFWDRNGWRVLYKEQVVGILAGLLICPLIWFLFSSVIPDRYTGFLQFVGRYSLDIYVVHILFTAAIRVLLVRIGLTYAIPAILINTVISTAVSILIAVILKKLHLHRFIYKPFSKVKKSRTVIVASAVMVFAAFICYIFAGLYIKAHSIKNSAQYEAQTGISTDETVNLLKNSSDLQVTDILSDHFTCGKGIHLRMNTCMDIYKIDGLDRIYVEIYAGLKRIGIGEWHYSGEEWKYDARVYIEDYYLHDDIDLTIISKIKINGKKYTVSTKKLTDPKTELRDIYECLDDAGSKDYITFMSVKDDAAEKMDTEMIQRMTNLGITSDFSNANRKGFYAVIDGKVIEEEIASAKGDTVSASGQIVNDITGDKIDYTLVSAGFEADNVSKIILNGTDYSMNRRGINVVVYDKKTNKVIDSSVYDTYLGNIKYFTEH